MKTTTAAILMLAALGWSIDSSRAQGVALDFSCDSGGYIQFGGPSDTFAFVSGSDGYQWKISNEQGGSSAIGLLGSVNNGPFGYGPITSSLGGTVQSADVTGPLGQLVINSASGNLTATINWVNVATVQSSVGVFNATLLINVAGITYAGTNPDLQLLTADQPGTLDLSFQFDPGESLTDLSSPGAVSYDTSFSGTISAGTPIPEPTTIFAGALLLLPLGVGIWRAVRKSPGF
jgi:hypothetical protein